MAGLFCAMLLMLNMTGTFNRVAGFTPMSLRFFLPEVRTHCAAPMA